MDLIAQQTSLDTKEGCSSEARHKIRLKATCTISRALCMRPDTSLGWTRMCFHSKVGRRTLENLYMSRALCIRPDTSLGWTSCFHSKGHRTLEVPYISEEIDCEIGGQKKEQSKDVRKETGRPSHLLKPVLIVKALIILEAEDARWQYLTRAL